MQINTNLLEKKFPLEMGHHGETKFMKLLITLKCMGSLQPTTVATAVGFWHLFIHLFGFILFISAFYLTPDYCHFSSYGGRTDVQEVAKTVPLLSSEPMNHVQNHILDTKLWLFVSSLSFIATIFMIWGIFEKRSVAIAPFLIFQLLDVLFDTLVLFVYVSQSSSVDEFFNQVRHPPFQQFLVKYGSQHKTMFAFLYLTVSFSIKVYFIKVVYFTYKVISVMERFKSRRVPSVLISSKS